MRRLCTLWDTALVGKRVCVCVFGLDMLRVSEGQGTRLPKTRAAPRSTLTSVLQFLGKSHIHTNTHIITVWPLIFHPCLILLRRASRLCLIKGYELICRMLREPEGDSWCTLCVPSLPESRPAAHTSRSHRTPGLQAPPPRRLLSSLPHGPHGMLGKRSYHHHSRAEPERRSGTRAQTHIPCQTELDLLRRFNLTN